MALPNHHIELSFNTGADESQETDITSAPIEILRDFEYRKDGGLHKRRGWQSVGTYDAGLGAAALVPGGTLVRNALLQFGSAMDAEASPRLQHTARITSERFANLVDSADLLDCDTAYCTDGRVCVAATRYDGSTYSVVIAVFDLTGRLLYRETVSSARRARVVAQGTGRFNVFYTSTSSNVISVRSIIGDPANGGTQSTTSALVNNHATYKAYDVCNGSGTDAYLVYNSVTTGRLQVAKISAACTVLASYDTTLTTADYPSVAYHPTSGHVRVAFGARGTDDAYILTVNGTPSSVIAGPTAVSTGTRPVIRTAICPLLASGNPFLSVFETSGSFESRVYATADTDSHSGGTSQAIYNHGIDTAPFGLPSSQFDTTFGEDRAYLGLMPLPRVTSGDTSGDIPTSMLGMLSVGYGGSFGGGTGLTFSPRAYSPVVPLIADGAAALPNPVSTTDGTAGRVVSGAGSLRYVAVPYIFNEADGSEHPAVLVLRLNTAPMPEPVVTFGASTYVGGGVLRFFDGQRFGELTPAWAPAKPVPTTVGSGANPAAGTYTYAAYAEWGDAEGNVHRSPVSQTVALVHAGGSVSVVLRFHAPSLLDTTNNIQRWTIRLYRTLTGGSTFRFVASAEISSADATVTITDTSSDSTISTHELLYTDGGILQAEAPPAFSAMTEHRGRLWGISAQDPRNIHASKVKEEAIAPEFSSSLVRRVDQSTPPLALASLDDKLLVATSSDVLTIVGEGPPSTGVESGSESWSVAEVVAPGVGATGPQAMLTTPLGVIMHSASGFKLIGRDLSVSDIGGALLDTAPGTATIRRSILVPKRQQAWFLLDGGNIVVFDYSRAKLRWSVFTCQAAASISDLTVLNGKVYLLGSDVLYVMDPEATTYDDAGTFVPAYARTGWLRPDGVLGEVRYRVVHAYGSSGTSGLRLTAEVQGGENHTSQVWEWDSTELGVRTPAHVRERLRYQRGQGLRITLLQVAGGAVDSEGFRPYAVGFDYGAHGRTGTTPGVGKPGA